MSEISLSKISSFLEADEADVAAEAETDDDEARRRNVVADHRRHSHKQRDEQKKV